MINESDATDVTYPIIQVEQRIGPMRNFLQHVLIIEGDMIFGTSKVVQLYRVPIQGFVLP